MGCVQQKEKKGTLTVSVPMDYYRVKACYKLGQPLQEDDGKVYLIVYENGQLRKVPVLKTLEANPLYSKRQLSRKASDATQMMV